MSSRAGDDAKKKVLARRATFIAAALAGVSCGKEPATNPPCLSPMPPTENTTTPNVCLSVAPQSPPPPDASAPAPTPPPEEPPHPCLSVRAPTADEQDAGGPKVCLRMIAPKKDVK